MAVPSLLIGQGQSLSLGVGRSDDGVNLAVLSRHATGIGILAGSALEFLPICISIDGYREGLLHLFHGPLLLLALICFSWAADFYADVARKRIYNPCVLAIMCAPAVRAT